MDDLETKLLGMLHGEHSSLTITFNDHACNYCTVKEAIERDDYAHADWVSDEEKANAVATNRVWVVQWYPNTPVGFCAVAASSLAAAISSALSD